MNILLWTGIALTILAVAGLGLSLYMFVVPRRRPVDRVREVTHDSSATTAARLVRSSRSAPVLASSMAKLATSSDLAEKDAQHRVLVQAGFRSPAAFEIYAATRVFLAFAFPILGVLLMPDLKLAYKAAAFMGLAWLGYLLPAIYVSSRRNTRIRALLRPFPDALDLLVTSTEAGLGLDAAFMRVSQEMEAAAPELARELQVVNHEVAAGIPRTEALHRLDARTGLVEITSLVNVMVQAERFGTSVAHALRVHSRMVRRRRMQQAEEKAAAISPKMTIAMILFLLPALFVVILGPAMVNMIRQLAPTLGIQL